MKLMRTFSREIVPERIRENRQPYILALRAADEAWKNGNLDTSQLEDYIAGLLQAQLAEAVPLQSI